MKDIVPLAYDLKKAKGGQLTRQSIYEGMASAYTGGNIGPISNNISKIWNSGEITEEKLNVIKWLVMKNNEVIDYAKTLWLSTPPDSIGNLISQHTKPKVPYFFIYAKDKQENQVEPANDSAMNRIGLSIPNPRVKYSKSIGKFDWRMLINENENFTVLKDNPIIQAYDYWNTHQYLFNSSDDIYLKQEDLYMYQQIRKNIIEQTGASLDFIVNSLVAYFYTVRESSNKKMLWSCFGDVILKNIQDNLIKHDLGKICSICGYRFKPKQSNYEYCSKDCSTIARREYLKRKKLEVKQNGIMCSMSESC